MQIQKLTLTNVRAFEQAEFTFQPGMNLLVGVNGAGKSTVLDALRIVLARTVPKFTVARTPRGTNFEPDGVRIGESSLTVNTSFLLSDQRFNYLHHLPREKSIPNPEWVDDKTKPSTIEFKERSELEPNDRTLFKKIKQSMEQPSALYFSAHRSILDTKQPSERFQSPAFGDALIHDRGLKVREYAEWWLAQEALIKENSESNRYRRRLSVLSETVCDFLDGCTKLYAESDPEPALIIEKDGKAINVRFMSDGERSIIALVLDIARRLAESNPRLEHPNQDGKAVVLIDELDLHLHPSWQRTIVNRLTRTFPNCQFICTTHSPLIISETQPSNLFLLVKEGGKILMRQRSHSYGLDANWILESFMNTSDRPELVQAQIDKIEDELEDGELDAARQELNSLREMMHDDISDVIRLESTINTLEVLAHEVD